MFRFKSLLRFAGVLLVVAINGGSTVQAAEPPKEPILRIETGMHTANIRRISLDAENRLLATASDDKTVRLWDARTGGLIRIIRPPVGEGNEGKIYAVALSPDGKIVAVGGWTQYERGKSQAMDFAIYLFDSGTGNLLRRLTGLPNVIFHLVFSRDGRYLAACLGQNNGIRIYRTSDFTMAGEDKDYGSDTYGAAFDPEGGLVTTSWDGYLRRYDSRFRLTAKVMATGGKQPIACAFSPDGRQVAVGFDDTTAVNVIDGRDLKFLFAPDTQGVGNGSLSSVAWSADGRRLYAAGKYIKQFDGIWKKPIRVWPDGGKGGYVDIPVDADDTIMDLHPRKGGVFFGAGKPAFGALDSEGKSLYTRNPGIGDYRDNHAGFQVSPDGAVIRFAYELFGKSPSVFALTERRLSTGANIPDGILLAAPRTDAHGLTVTDWKYTTAPKLNGVPLKLDQYEMSRSLAIEPSGRNFLLGADWSLRLFNAEGKEIWQAPVPSAAWAVNITGDGRYALAAFADGTIRWYSMSDGKEILAFFPHKDQKRWILWSASGYYDASPGGEELIGWHVNRGKDNAADFFPASRFRSTYYRPDIVAMVLETGNEAEAVRIANEESGRKTQKAQLDKILPPVVNILSPRDSEPFSQPQISIAYTVRNSSDEPVTGIRVLIDGRPARQERGLKVVGKGTQEETLKITLPEKDCEVSLIAENRFAASEPSTVRLLYSSKTKKTEEFVIKPKLYVLAIGVSLYKDKNLTLQFAAKDAKDFARAMEKQKGGLYRDVQVRLLTDNLATRDEVMDGLDWIQKETTAKDVAMVFIAGHGVNDPTGNYYFLPANVDTEKLKRTGVVFSDIKNTLNSLAGKALFFMDTCHSGNVMGGRRALSDITGLVNELASAENGVVVFASSTGKQYSLEDASWGNGAFTKALVDGLSGKADYTGKGKITINMLDLYISEKVKELTRGKQTPTTTKPQTIADFPVAVKR